MTRVIDSVFLKQDGKTVEVMCHFPFNLRTRTIPIKDFFIPRSDDLARRLRRNEELIDTRCIPLVYEGKEYKPATGITPDSSQQTTRGSSCRHHRKPSPDTSVFCSSSVAKP